ncbi:Pentatricopeptide repeat-containing protein [Hibiscus syriacus]|uniref:Pentatricopeptide repeat-containing protein n=1 Tax=Hibiscus syriacus TaxID=106335 RepID=A0A6A2ZJS4_HIBSY|nr:Pentatricopeptide repeat-containing protein [Hibiscus syriacus]
MSSQNHTKTLLFSLFPLTKTLTLTQQIHACIVLHGFNGSVVFGSRLTDAYIHLGSLQFAQKTFDGITRKNLHSWNTVISGYSNKKLFLDVLRLFSRMRREIVGVDSFNLVFAIKACVGLSFLKDGKLIHSMAVKFGLEGDAYVAPALGKMYGQLGSLRDARKVFDGFPERNSVLWGTMMEGYLKSSDELQVFELFRRMKESGVELDAFTVGGLVRACGNVSADKEGKMFHGLCIKKNFIGSNVYLQTSLIDMYLKCGLIDFGMKLFEDASERDVVLWSSMISGLAKNGKGLEAIALFRNMLRQPLTPNSATLNSILLACPLWGSLKQGKSVHGYMIRKGIGFDDVNYTSFIDMYAKCGSVAMARKVFVQMPLKNVVSWSAMINAYGIQGLCSEALACFDEMRSKNQVPNSVTFISILSACSHSGKTEEGWKYFKEMTQDFGIVPTQEHYACLVDLLGRAGKIDDALSFIDSMPIEPGASVWGALLDACRMHRRVELAENVSDKLLPLETNKASVYVLLSNIYADAGRWESVKKIRKKLARVDCVSISDLPQLKLGRGFSYCSA